MANLAALTGLQKAYIKILEPGKSSSPMSALSAMSGSLGGSKDTVFFSFNPKDYSVSKSAHWSRTTSASAKHAGPMQWQGAGPAKYDLDIFLDKGMLPFGDIRDDVKKLLRCCEPTDKSRRSGKGASGPHVLFGWGTSMSMKCVVTSVSIEFTRFRMNGAPFRAKGKISLEEVGEKMSRQNPTSGTLEAHRSRTVVAGDSLPLIAYAEYGDPNGWRAIAEANGIDDPLRLRGGTPLLIPERTETEVSP